MADIEQQAHIEELTELRRLVPSVNQRAALDAAIAALASRQPVGEPVGYMDPKAEFLLPRAEGCVLMGKVEICLWRDPAGKYTMPLYTAPPAAVDLGQLRELLDEWRARANRSGVHGFSAGRRSAYEACCEMLAALLDSKAVRS